MPGIQSSTLDRMGLGLLLLFCGATLSVSISTVRHRNAMQEDPQPEAEPEAPAPPQDCKYNRNKPVWDRNGPEPKYSKKKVEFGLRILAEAGVSITGDTFDKANGKISGCGSDGALCQCKYEKAEDNLHAFTMKGDGAWDDLNFQCKNVKFKITSTGQECKCNFKAVIDENGYRRYFEDDCQPQYCLENLFKIRGGGKKTPETAKKKIKHYSDTYSAGDTHFYGSCDECLYCPSWGHFKAGFENREDKRDVVHSYGNQYGDKAGKYTWDGYKWYFGLTFKPKDANAEKATPTLTGSWVPSSSGGQASFSQSMQWSSADEKSSATETSHALSLSFEASYVGTSLGMEKSQSWSDSASATNSATNGGDHSRTCAAYQCEGGTTWQWQMGFKTPKFKAHFDNCVFVCTPNQGTFPKCPFGSCCTAEDRSNECATCNNLWCKPQDINCPFHPEHPEHESYCGVTDESYINFLLMLRSRVASVTHVTERQDEDFRLLQEQVQIKKKAHRQLEAMYRSFNFSAALTQGADTCKPSGGKKKDIKKCQMCDVGEAGCANPTGSTPGGMSYSNNWCHKHCSIKKTKPVPEDTQLSRKVGTYLKRLGDEVMEEEMKKALKYEEVQLDQASDYNHEAGVKSLAKKPSDPCAGRKTAAPGSVIWCLCDEYGKKIKWSAKDDAKLRKAKKPDGSCSDPADPVRAKECKWKGDPAKGRCCSNKEGCPDALTPALNSEYYKIRDIDLATEDFSLDQLVRANTRLRMDCYYDVETKAEASNRLRKIHGVKKRDKSKPTPEEEKQMDIEKRKNLFLCFRKFYFHNQKKFSLQSIDQMLVEETTSCEDRLVNPKCVTHQPRVPSGDDVDLDGGGGGGEGGVSGAVEVNGGEGGGGLSGEDGKVCCHKKGKEKPAVAAECKTDDGDKEQPMKNCMGAQEYQAWKERREIAKKLKSVGKQGRRNQVEQSEGKFMRQEQQGRRGAVHRKGRSQDA